PPDFPYTTRFRSQAADRAAERSDHSPAGKRRHKRRSDQVAQFDRAWMLCQHAALPRAIAEKLPPQRTGRLAAVVARANVRGKVDAPTRAANAVVELVVLVDGERLVKAPHLFEDLTRPRAQVDGIDILGAATDGKAAWHAEWGAVRRRNRTAKGSSRFETLRPADVLRAGFTQAIDALTDVISRDDRVPVHAHDHIT